MNPPDPTPTPDSEASILAAFAVHNAATAATLPPGDSPLGPKVARIIELLNQIEPPADAKPGDYEPAPPNARAEVCELLATLSWPSQPSTLDPRLSPPQPSTLDPQPSTSEAPLTLTLAKQDLCERLFRQDGAATEVDRRWISSAKIILYVAVHDNRTFARYYSSLPAQLIAVHEWYEQNITDLPTRDLMCEATWALWHGHRITLSVPAPAPHGTHTSGN